MAIDLKKMRNKLDKLEGKGRTQSMFWKPQDGDQTIRILPMPDGDPFREMWFHYNLGENRGFLSPKRNFGEDDPLDAFVRKLFSDGEPNDIKMAKDLMARQRFFSPVIVRGEEDKGVRLWGYGKMAYKELVTLALNPDYDDITDPESGTDLVINYGKPPGASFPKTSITPRRRSSPLFSDDQGGAKAAAALNEIPDFDEVFAESRKTPAEVGQMLNEWLAGESDSGQSVEKYGGSAEANTVDQKLDELLSSSAAF